MKECGILSENCLSLQLMFVIITTESHVNVDKVEVDITINVDLTMLIAMRKSN